jgi:hypothetical protein
MKNFLQFLKEEVDLKGNKGIDDDFMKKAEDQAKQNTGVTPNANLHGYRQPPVDLNIGELMSKSAKLLTNGLSTDQIEERYTKLEQLAKRVIMDEYGDIIEASEKPVELIIKLIRPNQSVLGEVPNLLNVPEVSDERPEYSEEEEPIEQGGEESQESQESQEQEEEEDDFFSFFDDDTDYQDQEEENPEEVEELTNRDVAMAIDKKKILNMLTQGEGKATKDIIKFSEVVENGLREILGDSYRQLLNIWIKTSEVAHKMDWATSDIEKASSMKNLPGGLAGAVDLTWESVDNTFHKINLLTENTDFNKIVIRAYGIDFPMLLHESIKGIYMLLQSSAIKKDDEIAEEIKRATSSFKDESQDFKYGVPAQNMFRDFINSCKDADKYTQMRARVFAFLAVDKDRGGRYTDEEFLEITKSLFSCFDRKLDSGKMTFVINQEKFTSSKAKTEIEKIIADIVRAEDDYREALNKWEMEQRFGHNQPEPQSEGEEDGHPEPGEDEAQSEIDKLIRNTANKEQSRDESELSKRELQELIDTALDEGDYEEVKRLSAFMKEGAEIYLREVERINESKITRRK